MTLGTLFWLIFVVWVIFGFYRDRATPLSLGYHGVVAVLIFLLGWHVFGFVIHS